MSENIFIPLGINAKKDERKARDSINYDWDVVLTEPLPDIKVRTTYSLERNK